MAKEQAAQVEIIVLNHTAKVVVEVVVELILLLILAALVETLEEVEEEVQIVAVVVLAEMAQSVSSGLAQLVHSHQLALAILN
jgi:hypothetical protein